MEEMELTPLKKVYDELWRDAKTMIKDLNTRIKLVFFFGLMLLVVAVLELFFVFHVYRRFAINLSSELDRIYLPLMLVCAVSLLLVGALMIRYYNTLKNRYVRLLQLEQRIED